MFNKNILYIVVAVVLVGGGIFYFASTGNTPGAGSGLTRAKAGQMIWESIKDTKVLGSVGYTEGVSPSWPVGYTLSGNDESELERQGLIKITGETSGGDTVLDFTDKAQPYILPTSWTLPHMQKNKDILFATPTRVEVTGLTEPSEDGGAKTIMAEYTVYYDVTPFGLILDDDLKDGQKGGGATFTLYDDGWRL